MHHIFTNGFVAKHRGFLVHNQVLPIANYSEMICSMISTPDLCSVVPGLHFVMATPSVMGMCLSRPLWTKGGRDSLKFMNHEF